MKSLIKLIQDVPAKKKGGKNTPAKMLKRPIICICNDLSVQPLLFFLLLSWLMIGFGDRYAPSLRALRPFARIVRFNKPPTAILVKRLKGICEAEGLQADTRSLNKLSEVTGGDIRSCLNTLQVRSAFPSSVVRLMTITDFVLCGFSLLKPRRST